MLILDKVEWEITTFCFHVYDKISLQWRSTTAWSDILQDRSDLTWRETRFPPLKSALCGEGKVLPKVHAILVELEVSLSQRPVYWWNLEVWLERIAGRKITSASECRNRTWIQGEVRNGWLYTYFRGLSIPIEKIVLKIVETKQNKQVSNWERVKSTQMKNKLLLTKKKS